MAKNKFQQLLGRLWPIPGFDEVVRKIYQISPADDRDLQMMICKLCAEHIDDVLAQPTLLRLALDLQELAVGMLVHLNSLHATREQQASRASKAVQDELEETRANL